MRVNELMLYRHMEQGQVLNDMAFLMENYDNEYYNKEDLRGLLFDSVNEILELAVSHGLTGNLWHDYLTFLLASDENAYSTSCEIRGDMGGTLSHMAKQDFQVFMDLFACDIRELDALTGGTPVWSELASYVPVDDGSRVFNKRVRDRIVELAVTLAGAKTVEEFQKDVTQFYR